MITMCGNKETLTCDHHDKVFIRGIWVYNLIFQCLHEFKTA